VRWVIEVSGVSWDCKVGCCGVQDGYRCGIECIATGDASDNDLWQSGADLLDIVKIRLLEAVASDGWCRSLL